jgi:hypothetical protein
VAAYFSRTRSADPARAIATPAPAARSTLPLHAGSRVLATWRQHEGSITVADRSLRRAQEFIELATTYFRRPEVPAALQPLRVPALSRAHWYASWVLQETAPVRSALHLRRSYALMPEDLPGMPAQLKRFERPSRKAVLRTMRQAVAHRWS